jgi:hypothetical protein
VWSAIEIASSMQIVVGLGFLCCVNVSHDQPFKALHGYRRECYGSVVIQADYLSVLGHRDYGGLL